MANVNDTASDASRRRSLTARRWKRGAAADITGTLDLSHYRHCEEPLRRSNPDCLYRGSLDCFAALAMTVGLASCVSMTLEIIERFAAGPAAPERLAGGGAEFGQQLGIRRAALRARNGLLAEQCAARIRSLRRCDAVGMKL